MSERNQTPEGAVPGDRSMPEIVGTPVEVRSRFEGTWCRGFQIAEVLTDLDRVLRYRVRRVSDGQILPSVFSSDDITPHTAG